MRFGVALLLLITFNPLGVLATAQDHLEPETGIFTPYEWQSVYAQNIREVLLKNSKPNHQARMICCPSFAPEWVVTVSRQGEGEMFTQRTRSYFVEYVVANEQIWNDEKKTVKAGVKRAKASLDRETAEAVSEVWHQMLMGVRRSGHRNRSEDGVTFHFTRAAGWIKGGPPSAGGEGKAWMPDEDKFMGPPGELAAIGVALKEYANAKHVEREKMALRIRAQAMRLIDKLGQVKEPEQEQAKRGEPVTAACHSEGGSMP